MKLCIADPPYLGRAADWYGDGMHPTRLGKNAGGTGIGGPRPADHHPDAARWDDLETHRALLTKLMKDYDGWVVAMAHDNLRDYLPMIPRTYPIRICIWNKTQQMPSGARILNSYEPVLVHIPEGRRASNGQTIFLKDCVTIPRPNIGFAGAKPGAWTRWVLDLMGYDPELDTVDDLFEGSGSVQKELAQGVLL